MLTEREIITTLSQVIDPELHRNIVELGMVRHIQVHDALVEVELALTTASCPLSQKIADDVRAAVKALPGAEQVMVTLSEMTPEERAAALGQAQPEPPKASQLNQVDQVIAVMSGKGGVGKSSVTALLALALARRGYRVGILDADITGPSIPRLFGLRPGEVYGSALGILPPIAAEGIKVMSINLLLPDEDTAVIWRGPLIAGALQQFWTEVIWGRLDVLLVDLPPGTSDAALTVMQSLPVTGVIVVTTPQELAAMVVRKAVHMARQLNVPVLGVVENMSYFICPDTGKHHQIFGPSHAEEVAAAAGAPVLARLPIDPQLTARCDVGKVAAVTRPEIEALVEALTRTAAAPAPRLTVTG